MRSFEDYMVGETYRTRSHTVTASEVDSFVHQIGVSNPLFLDEAQAQKGPFQSRIIPGFLTISIALGLLYTPQIIQDFLLTEAHAEFLKPVHIGDTIRVTGIIAQKQETSQKAGLLTLDNQIQNQHTQTTTKLTLKISLLKQQTNTH